MLDCTARCRGPIHGAHIYVQAPPMAKTLMDDVTVILTSYISRKHLLSTASVTFFNASADAVKSNRFRVRDLFLQGNIKPIYDCQFDHQDFDNGHSCNECFNQNTDTIPLHWSEFDVEREWVLDVPLEEQLLFESFLSRKTLERTHDVKGFLKTKYVRMYALYDSLLNLANKNHFGVIQELNTSELMVNYHCLTDIF